jgi:hypothetical protein
MSLQLLTVATILGRQQCLAHLDQRQVFGLYRLALEGDGLRDFTATKKRHFTVRWLIIALVLASLAIESQGSDGKPKSDIDTSDWPKSSAFPTTYSVTCYSKEAPHVGELIGVFPKLKEARQKSQTVRASPGVQRVEISVDPGADDAYPKRAEHLVRAVREGLSQHKKECNFLVQDVLGAYDENKALKGQADDILAFLLSDKARAAGWLDVNRVAATEGKDAMTMATALANQGYLVVGAISKATLNGPKKPSDVRRVYKNGHVFVVFPSESPGWEGALVANAGTSPTLDEGDKPTDEELEGRIVPVTQAVTDWQRPLYQFFAIKMN